MVYTQPPRYNTNKKSCEYEVEPMRKMSRIVLMVLALGAIMFACRILIRDELFMDSQERRYPDVFFSSYSNHGSYRFEPDTILSSVIQGEVDVFTITDVALAEPIYHPPFQWKQSDYLMVANALHQFVWKETLDEWDLHDIALDGECKSIPNFNIFNVSYYKITGLQEYSAHMIGIYPLAGEGEWGGGGRFPRSIFRKWDYINLAKLVRVEDVLRIAEENGGELARFSVKNRCRIHIGLGPYPYPAWRVSYDLSGSASEIFRIEIDAYTGEYELPTP